MDGGGGCWCCFFGRVGKGVSQSAQRTAASSVHMSVQAEQARSGSISACTASALQSLVHGYLENSPARTGHMSPWSVVLIYIQSRVQQCTLPNGSDMYMDMYVLYNMYMYMHMHMLYMQMYMQRPSTH
jgi:hypothetical protein